MLFAGRRRFGGRHCRAPGRAPGAARDAGGAAVLLSAGHGLRPARYHFRAFFGVDAATITGVSRLARLRKRACCRHAHASPRRRLRGAFLPAWEDYPGASIEADTRRMNAFVEDEVRQMPEQYLWVHKRSRPARRGRRRGDFFTAEAKRASAHSPARRCGYTSPMSFVNPEPEQLCALLKSVNTIAVVGFRPSPDGLATASPARCRPSVSHHPGAARHQRRSGRRPDLGSVPGPVDLANVFRSSKYVPQSWTSACAGGSRTSGCRKARSTRRRPSARAAGMTVVMGRCIMRDYTRFCRG